MKQDVKTITWRPTEEYYASVREVYGSKGSETAMLNDITEQWLVLQSEAYNNKEVKQSEALPVNLEPITSMLQEVLSLLKEKESPVRTTSVQKEEKEDDFAREVREKILNIQELPPLPPQKPKEEDWEIVEDKGEDW